MKLFEQRQVARVGEECLRPQHQPDGGPAHVVVGHRLRLEHAARDTVNQEQSQRIDQRAQEQRADAAQRREVVVPAGIGGPRMGNGGEQDETRSAVGKRERIGGRKRAAPGMADQDRAPDAELLQAPPRQAPPGAPARHRRHPPAANSSRGPGRSIKMTRCDAASFSPSASRISSIFPLAPWISTTAGSAPGCRAQGRARRRAAARPRSP